MSESYIEVFDALTYLRDSGAQVQVSFQGEEISYPCTVTALNARHKIMVVQNIKPVASLHDLKRGRVLTITAKSGGREIHFKAKFVEPVVPDFSLGYEVTIPELLDTEQPRGALRYALDQIRDGVKVTLTSEHNQTIRGYAKNISRYGLAVVTDTEIPRLLADYFSAERNIVGCQITLDSDKLISCSMEITNVQTNASTTGGALLGGRILNVGAKENRLLGNFISQLQQQHLQAVA